MDPNHLSGYRILPIQVSSSSHFQAPIPNVNPRPGPRGNQRPGHSSGHGPAPSSSRRTRSASGQNASQYSASSTTQPRPSSSQGPGSRTRSITKDLSRLITPTRLRPRIWRQQTMDDGLLPISDRPRRTHRPRHPRVTLRPWLAMPVIPEDPNEVKIIKEVPPVKKLRTIHQGVGLPVHVKKEAQRLINDPDELMKFLPPAATTDNCYPTCNPESLPELPLKSSYVKLDESLETLDLVQGYHLSKVHGIDKVHHLWAKTIRRRDRGMIRLTDTWYEKIGRDYDCQLYRDPSIFILSGNLENTQHFIVERKKQLKRDIGRFSKFMDLIPQERRTIKKLWKQAYSELKSLKRINHLECCYIDRAKHCVRTRSETRERLGGSVK